MLFLIHRDSHLSKMTFYISHLRRSIALLIVLGIILTLVLISSRRNRLLAHKTYISPTKHARNGDMLHETRLFGTVSGSINTNGSSMKIILAYRSSRWINEWVGSRMETSELFRTCPVSNCILSRNSTLQDSADAVMYGWKALKNCNKKKKRGQVWIFFEYESPGYFYRRNANFDCFRNVINWTFTYRRDSDFTLAHGQFSAQDNEFNITELEHLVRSKTKTAVGFISHCRAHSGRDEYIRRLRSYGLDIDIYGRCGNLKCGGGLDEKWKGIWNVTSRHSDDCFDVLDNRYKFYLSFENSLCEDYVTEKSLHLVLRHQIIPIIRDGANRSLYHPPKSYIDTKDFKGMQQLAKRLKYLSQNIDEYMDYLKWKKHYSVETVAGVLQSVFCDMCLRLHDPEQYRRLYADFDKFFRRSHGKEKYICKGPMETV